MNKSLTKDHIFQAYFNGELNYFRVMSIHGYDNYYMFLADVFKAGYDYPRHTEENVRQTIMDYNELFAENFEYVPQNDMKK